MDKKRWEQIAKEMQEHLDAIQKIAEREGMDLVSISVHTSPEVTGNELRTSATYIDENYTIYSSNKYSDGEMGIYEVRARK